MLVYRLDFFTLSTLIYILSRIVFYDHLGLIYPVICSLRNSLSNSFLSILRVILVGSCPWTSLVSQMLLSRSFMGSLNSWTLLRISLPSFVLFYHHHPSIPTATPQKLYQGSQFQYHHHLLTYFIRLAFPA